MRLPIKNRIIIDVISTGERRFSAWARRNLIHFDMAASLLRMRFLDFIPIKANRDSARNDKKNSLITKNINLDVILTEEQRFSAWARRNIIHFDMAVSLLGLNREHILQQ